MKRRKYSKKKVPRKRMSRRGRGTRSDEVLPGGPEVTLSIGGVSTTLILEPGKPMTLFTPTHKVTLACRRQLSQ